MAQKRQEHSKSKSPHAEPSSAFECEAADLRAQFGAKFDQLSLDTHAFMQAFPRQFPVRLPLTIAAAVKSSTQMDKSASRLGKEVAAWRNRSCKLLKRFVARLGKIRRDLDWVTLREEEAWQEFEPKCRAWIAIACGLTARVMVDCDAGFRNEAVEAVRVENENALARTRRIAISRVARKISENPKASRYRRRLRVDPVKIRIAAIKRKFPTASIAEICVLLDRGNAPIPAAWKKAGMNGWVEAWKNLDFRQKKLKPFISKVPAAAKS